MILPSWSESMLNDECVTNIHDYIMYNDIYDNEDITIQKITENVDDIHNFDNKRSSSSEFIIINPFSRKTV